MKLFNSEGVILTKSAAAINAWTHNSSVRVSGKARSNFDMPTVAKYTGLDILGIFSCLSLNLIIFLFTSFN
ncbi:hypothetical protein ES708_26636 [subsurface metagenome]